MSVYNTSSAYIILTTTLALLSTLTCNLSLPTTPAQTPTTVLTTPPPTVVKTPTTPAQAVTTLTTPVRVTAIRALNVRVRPSEQSPAYREGLYHGSTVTLTGKCSEGWAQIEWLNGTAWVNADYLSDNKCKEER